MNEIYKTNLTDQRNLRLETITEIQDYFHKDINQRKLCSKKLTNMLLLLICNQICKTRF